MDLFSFDWYPRFLDNCEITVITSNSGDIDEDTGSLVEGETFTGRGYYFEGTTNKYKNDMEKVQYDAAVFVGANVCPNTKKLASGIVKVVFDDDSYADIEMTIVKAVRSRTFNGKIHHTELYCI